MGHQVNEHDISSTLKDIEALCSYIMENKPLLTPKGALGMKTCFELNSLMTNQEAGVKTTNRMESYPSISLFFSLAMRCGLLETYAVGGQKAAVKVSEAYTLYQQMNDYTKYLTLFLAWMRYTDYENLYHIRLSFALSGMAIINAAFERMRLIGQPMRVERNIKQLQYPPNWDALQIIMNYCPVIMRSLRDLGLVSFAREDAIRIDTYTNFITQITVTGLGVAMSTVCATRRFTWVNEFEEQVSHFSEDDDEVYEIYENDYEKNLPGSAGFLQPFLACFPDNAIDTGFITQLLFPPADSASASGNMVYEFKVQLERDCYRVIQCAGNHTFEDLHLKIQQAFDFDDDHLYAFFMDGKRWSQRSIKSPYAEEPPFANEICIGQAGLRVKQVIVYMFDFGASWEFKVKLNEIRENDAILPRPQIVKSVGEAPPQYPGTDEDWDWEEV